MSNVKIRTIAPATADTPDSHYDAREASPSAGAQALAARHLVQDLIDERIAKETLPVPAQLIVTGPWCRLLSNTYVTDGEDSPLWGHQLRVVELLIWSVSKDVPKGGVAFERVIEALHADLRGGLEQVGYDDDLIEQLLQALAPYQGSSAAQTESQQQTATEPEQSGNDARAANSDPVTRFIAEVELSLLADPIGAPTNEGGSSVQECQPDEDDTEAYIDLARTLEVGHWIEFEDEFNRVVRAKLARKSELLNEFTFLNCRERYVSERTLQGLAMDLRRGTARIMAEAPWMDRAVDAIFERLGIASPESE